MGKAVTVEIKARHRCPGKAILQHALSAVSEWKDAYAIGTGRAMEMGQVQGAMSSVAIGVAGILTTLLSLVW